MVAKSPVARFTTNPGFDASPKVPNVGVSVTIGMGSCWYATDEVAHTEDENTLLATEALRLIFASPSDKWVATGKVATHLAPLKLIG